MSPKQIRLKIFRSLCWHDCDFMCSHIPLPTTVISRMLGISLYQCRKQMRILVEYGLAESCSCVVDREECPLPYHGFRITEKGRKSDIAKYCSLQHARICARCFGGSAENWLSSDFDDRWLGREDKIRIRIDRSPGD